MIFLMVDLLVRTSVLFVSLQRGLPGGADRSANQTAGPKINSKPYAKWQGFLQDEEIQ